MKIKTFSVNHYNRMGWGTKISRADHYFRKNWSGGTKIFNEKIGPQDQNYRDQNSSDSPICYKNVLRLNGYNFRTVNAIDFLFSTLHSTPFLYVDLYFRVLHKLHADVMRPDYPWGSKLPHLQVGASNSFQIQCVCRGVLSLLIYSVR